jgi:hypothetical protein
VSYDEPPQLAGMAHALSAIAEVARRVTDLSERVDELAALMDAPAAEDVEPGGRGYQPEPVTRWWALRGEDRAAAVARLRAWTDEIFTPGYGHLATLPPCWVEHDLCLYVVDWLAELWSVLYVTPRRTPALLAGQAEFTTRFLPAAADLISKETRGCAHKMNAGVRP